MADNIQNPFTYTFGVKPDIFISNDQSEEILKNYSFDNPSERSFMITGTRGSGKTVMLSDISEHISRQKNWIVIDLNPARDLLTALGSKLCETSIVSKYSMEAKIDFSFLGFGVSISGGNKIFDIESAIEKMLDILQKKNLKVLITIDEASANKHMQVFCLSFQRFIRQRYPIYMIMTGLYNKIHNIKNMDGCTFLQRAPYIVLNPLEIASIMVEYKRILGLPKEDALSLAERTKGYAFAFQVLGKLYFDKKDSTPMEDILLEYECELIKYSYNKIWSELSDKDIEFIKGIASAAGDFPISKKELSKVINLSDSVINRYQGRLKEKGVLTSNSHGYYEFALPAFGNFVREYH